MKTQTVETRRANDIGWLLRASVPSSVIAALLSALVLVVRLAQAFLDVSVGSWQEVALGWLTVVGGGLGAISTAAMLYRWSLILRRRTAFRLGEEMKDQVSNLPDYAQDAMQHLSSGSTQAVKQRLRDLGGRMGSMGAQVTQTVALAIVVATLIPATVVGGSPVLVASTPHTPASPGPALPTFTPWPTPTPIPPKAELSWGNYTNLGDVPCGAGQMQVPITNTGHTSSGQAAPVNVYWKADVVVGDPASSPVDTRFQPSPASGALAPGATVTVTVSGPFQSVRPQWVYLRIKEYATADPGAEPYDELDPGERCNS